jgi:uncharacterized protein YbjT (DUF2867 family)
MRILLTGATGMVGQGTLRECLLSSEVTEVLAIGRTPAGQQHPKLRQLTLPDIGNLSGYEDQLTGFDACLFCAGISSVGLSEAEYTRITYDLTLSFARTLVSLNPQMTFIFISGMGSDSTEKGRTMWARVKGRTENELQRLGFKSVYVFRPGFIQPLHGVRSKTRLYQFIYDLTAPLMPLLQTRLKGYINTTDQIGRAMIRVAREGYAKTILEPADINSIA